MGIYDYTVKAQDGSDVSLADYKGKVILIMNTATGCGFTPQYEILQQLYERYKDKGFEILDFPCNQFGGQAPESDEEIHEFCTCKFGVTFPQFKKVDVNGPTADPLWAYITSTTKFEKFTDVPQNEPVAKQMEQVAEMMDPDWKNNGNIKWNFTKFLYDRDGNFVGRYEPLISFNTIAADIDKVI